MEMSPEEWADYDRNYSPEWGPEDAIGDDYMIYCPRCDEYLTHEPADRSVGIMEAFCYCETCGWPEEEDA
jgi:hypothetical protein